MSEERFDFRWGIPALDRDFLIVPACFFRHYQTLGVSGTEFVFILHLAAFKHNSPTGRSEPRLSTIAGEMGYTRRYMRMLRASLEEKELLEVTFREGEPSIYSFSRFAASCLKLEDQRLEELRGGTSVPPPPEPQFLPSRNSTSPHEEEEKDINKSVGVDHPGRQALIEIGMAPVAAVALAERHPLEEIRAWIDLSYQQPGIRSLAAFVRWGLESGVPLPATPAERREKYPSCPGCNYVVPAEDICPDCGLCTECCECELPLDT